LNTPYDKREFVPPEPKEWGLHHMSCLSFISQPHS